jgi:hypothetical protein
VGRLLFGHINCGQFIVWLHKVWTGFYLVTESVDWLIFGYGKCGQVIVWLHKVWTGYCLVT